MNAPRPKCPCRWHALLLGSTAALALSIAVARSAPVRAADAATGVQAPPARAAKTGVLLVSHGSRSASWRKMLTEFHDDVQPRLEKLPGISGVKSAFMEYTEPSIATRLKQFDQEGYEHVILVPLLLTVSSHSFDDIPTIIGAKEDARSLAAMKAEGVQRYTPRAAVTITPLLDFSELLQQNLPRRINALSRDPAHEGVVLVAYGDEAYNQEWTDFFNELGKSVCRSTGVAAASHCWCGHVVHYSREPTKDAVRQILAKHQRAIVIPVLVAKDEAFQDQLIGKAVEELAAGDRVSYLPDAILPDAKLADWVVEVTRNACKSIHGKDADAVANAQP